MMIIAHEAWLAVRYKIFKDKTKRVQSIKRVVKINMNNLPNDQLNNNYDATC